MALQRGPVLADGDRLAGADLGHGRSGACFNVALSSRTGIARPLPLAASTDHFASTWPRPRGRGSVLLARERRERRQAASTWPRPRGRGSPRWRRSRSLPDPASTWPRPRGRGSTMYGALRSVRAKLQRGPVLADGDRQRDGGVRGDAALTLASTWPRPRGTGIARTHQPRERPSLVLHRLQRGPVLADGDRKKRTSIPCGAAQNVASIVARVLADGDRTLVELYADEARDDACFNVGSVLADGDRRMAYRGSRLTRSGLPLQRGPVLADGDRRPDPSRSAQRGRAASTWPRPRGRGSRTGACLAVSLPRPCFNVPSSSRTGIGSRPRRGAGSCSASRSFNVAPSSRTGIGRVGHGACLAWSRASFQRGPVLADGGSRCAPRPSSLAGAR